MPCPAGGLAAICAPAEEREVTPDALWRHEEVVEALMEDRDLLPVRFGTRLDDDAAAARSVAERRVELECALERVRGAVELSVRAVLAEPAADAGARREQPAPTTCAPGAARRPRRTPVASAVHEPLAALARAARAASPAPARRRRCAPPTSSTAASVGAFARLVARLDERHPELRLLCTGPWPPYSFAER